MEFATCVLVRPTTQSPAEIERARALSRTSELERMLTPRWEAKLEAAQPDVETTEEDYCDVCNERGWTTASAPAWRKHQLIHQPLVMAQLAARVNQCGARGTTFSARPQNLRLFRRTGNTRINWLVQKGDLLLPA